MILESISDEKKDKVQKRLNSLLGSSFETQLDLIEMMLEIYPTLVSDDLNKFIEFNNQINQLESQELSLMENIQKEVREKERNGSIPQVMREMSRFSYDVMISYSHANSDCAELILQHLQNSRLRV
jgi:hypothetical protein